MSNVVEFKPKPKADSYFGVCPHCHSNDGFLNIERDEWMICHRHQVKWQIGSNLFSDWQDETEEEWARNRYRLERYMTVEPHFPTSCREVDNTFLDDFLP